MKRAVLFLGLAVLAVAGCLSQVPTLTPAERVKYGVEALEASCGVYLSSDGPREPNLDELCKAIAKPPAVSAVPYPAAAPAGEGGRLVAGEPKG